jgi:hypothetical protein
MFFTHSTAVSARQMALIVGLPQYSALSEIPIEISNPTFIVNKRKDK